nr:hypothetical protein [Tanacetum cinerariifolium]
EQDIDNDEGDEKDESDDGEEDDDDDKDGDESDDDDDDDKEEIAKIDVHDDTERGGDDDEESENDEESDNEETKEVESFDPIPRTPEDSEDDGNGKEDQGLRISEEERIHEEEEADELYRDVDINLGRGLQVSQDIEDSHVTLTSVHPDGQQESSSMSSQFVTSMLNLTSDVVCECSIESEVLTRSSHSSRTSYAVAADLSEMELKKILIEKMEGNQSTQRSDEQRNLYKALVEAYEADKIILDTYGERGILKRRRDDDDQGEGPSAGSDRGSKRQREGKEPELACAPLEPATRSAGRSTTGSKSRQTSASKSAFAEEPVQTTSQIEEPSHLVFKTGAEDQPIVQTSQHPKWFSQPKKPLTPDRDWNKTLPPISLIPDNRGRRVIPFAHFINNDLEYLQGGASSRKYTTSITKTKAADYGDIKWIKDLVPRYMWIQEPINYDKHALWGVSHWGRKRQQFYGFAVNRESALDVYSKRRIIDVNDLKIVEWHNYKHLDWILLSNLTVEERFAFNVSLRMFTRSIVIQGRVEDLQLGVESYQKRLNLTKTDTYRSDLKRQEAYTAHSNPRGFIYQNKDKKTY